ncbi:hypothetical protein Q7P37_011174 [Cladosporium fusiforme]
MPNSRTPTTSMVAELKSGTSKYTDDYNNMADSQHLSLDDHLVEMPSHPKSAESPSQPTIATQPSLFEEDLDENPHSHFLSPVHTYETWDDSDNESDDGSYPLDAGIMDFALFTDDYNRAKEQNLPLPDKWDGLITDQAEAYDRAIARTRAELADRPPATFYSQSSSSQPRDAVPALTPDTSPRLTDDLDFEEPSSSSSSSSNPNNHATSSPITIPTRGASKASSNLSSISESAIDDNDFEDAATPAFLLYQHSQRNERRRRLSPNSQAQPPLIRPGLSAGRRTLSGKLHVWKRPSWELYSVFEDDEEAVLAGQSAGAARKEGGEGLRRKKGMEELRG